MKLGVSDYLVKDLEGGFVNVLPLAHAIVVEKHGGTIDFETEVGRGSTFIVRLPVDAETESPIIDNIVEELIV